MSLKHQIKKQLRYKAWANQVSFKALKPIPLSELEKPRETTFGTIMYTLNHIFVVDDIFKSHLSGETHGYTKRNTEDCPCLSDLEHMQTQMDRWFLDYVEKCSESQLQDHVQFTFVGGGKGDMTVFDILQHLVNHGSYHHGFVSDMMYQIPVVPPANDYPVFLRDVYSD